MADPMELFRLYKDDIYRFALSYTHSREDAEDICQTVFEQLLRHPSIASGKEKAWLMQTCANRCKNLLRSHWWSRTAPLEDVHSVPGQTSDPVKEATGNPTAGIWTQSSGSAIPSPYNHERQVRTRLPFFFTFSPFYAKIWGMIHKEMVLWKSAERFLPISPN